LVLCGRVSTLKGLKSWKNVLLVAPKQGGFGWIFFLPDPNILVDVRATRRACPNIFPA
jgi:hypothetical protein